MRSTVVKVGSVQEPHGRGSTGNALHLPEGELLPLLLVLLSPELPLGPDEFRVIPPFVLDPGIFGSWLG